MEHKTVELRRGSHLVGRGFWSVMTCGRQGHSLEVYRGSLTNAMIVKRAYVTTGEYADISAEQHKEDHNTEDIWWSHAWVNAIRNHRQQTGAGLKEGRSWAAANFKLKRVLYGSLTASWGVEEMVVVGWVSQANDAPNLAGVRIEGRIEELGRVSLEWLESVPTLPIDLDLRVVNQEPLVSLLPRRLGFAYYRV